jgi:hypothetical protein
VEVRAIACQADVTDREQVERMVREHDIRHEIENYNHLIPKVNGLCASPAQPLGEDPEAHPPRALPQDSRARGTGYLLCHREPAVGGEGGGAGVTVQGLPLLKPPYGRITAIDLESGTRLGKYRIIDFKRRKDGVWAKVVAIEPITVPAGTRKWRRCWA